MHKLIGVFHRLFDIFRLLPIRVYRIALHLTSPLRLAGKRNQFQLAFWLVELAMLIGDLFGLGEIYEIVQEFGKFNCRPLHDWEIQLAKTVYGDTINYKRVRIDEYAFLGPKQMHFAYVSFYHINAWGPLQNSLLIHELIHIWQYEQFGSVYMPRALRAQNTPKAYDYGGVEQLIAFRDENKSILDFNYEQQGDLVADYFRIKNGYRPQWGYGEKKDLSIYEYFVDQIRYYY